MTSPRPSSPTRTTTQLLDALRDPRDEASWASIDARFRPVVQGLAGRMGLNYSEAEEAAQQTLAEFVRAYRDNRYDRASGRLSSWILGIARNTILGQLKRRGAAEILGEDERFSDAHMRSAWTEERDLAVLGEALSMLRDDSGVDDRTLLAFELTGLRGVPATEAASQCGMTVDQVYVAKSRITRRLRDLVRELTDAFEEDR
ncbi:MAG: RNA polymerase sigma factor [Phycisphaerales bacterium]|nr:RNA polymerase sigma factor [Phycisphaerales bacterium]